MNEIDDLRAENTRLRAALAYSDRPCIYCTLPQEEWSRCQHGFPGCARADDAMGCPHLASAFTAYWNAEQSQSDGVSEGESPTFDLPGNAQ